MKVCFVCNSEKPLSEFYPHKQMADGHLNKCKDCTKSYTKERDKRLRENPIYIFKERERGRIKYERLYSGLDRSNRNRSSADNRHKNRYPEKFAARNKAQHIEAPKGFHRHHWSYRTEHAKDVIIISNHAHSHIHRYLNYMPSRMIYMRVDTNEILDSREKHERFINQLIKKPCGLSQTEMAGI